MAPRNSDFPNYNGISVEHTNFDAIEYHKPKSSASKEQKVGGFQPVQGMVSPRKRRVHTQPEATPEVLEQTRKAAMKDWRDKGLSNNEITDY